MHFLVLGATGAIGIKFCELALDERHTLTLFVRNKSKIPVMILQNQNVKVVEGLLDDEAALDRASHCSATGFVSFAGPPVGSKGTPLTNGYKALMPKLISQSIKRILVLCTPSYRCENDIVTFKWRAGEWFMKIFSPGQYLEMVNIGEYISSLPVDEGVKWTLFRVGGLTNTSESVVKATCLGSGQDGMWISRASVARWVLDEAIQEQWVGEVPYICDA